MQITELTALIGCVTGVLSLSIILYHFYKEHANVKVDVEMAFHFSPIEQDKSTKRQMLIFLKIINKSSSAFTIGDILIFKNDSKKVISKLSFRQISDRKAEVSNSQNFSIGFDKLAFPLPYRVEPNDIIRYRIFFDFVNCDLDNDFEYCYLQLETPFKSKKFKFKLVNFERKISDVKIEKLKNYIDECQYS